MGSVVAIMLLWPSTIAVFVPEFLIRADPAKVLIENGCIGSGPVTVFSLILLQVSVASVLLKRCLAPTVFQSWKEFDDLKQRKLVGFFAQITVRASVAVQILSHVWSQMNLRDGLFSNLNAKTAYQHMMDTKRATTCGEERFDPNDVLALRAWTFAKYHMIAVHIWELSFIPDLTLDSWLHHVFVICVASLASDPEALTGRPEIQPFVDSIGFFFILGASLNFLVKACVVMYHYSAPVAMRQAIWMWASTIGGLIIMLVFYIALPVAILCLHFNDFGLKTVALLSLLILFLSMVELRLLLVKRIIANNAMLKARRQVHSNASPIYGSEPAPRSAVTSWLSCAELTNEDLKEFEIFG